MIQLHKLIFTLVLILCVSEIYAQEAITPGTDLYRERKAQGLLGQPEQVPEQDNYPILLDGGTAGQAMQNRLALSTTSISTGCTIENPENDASFSVLPANDDESTGEVSLGFDFNFFGTVYTSLYVNNNGNITFNEPTEDYTSTGFPTTYDMIAPFWADVDTEPDESGKVYYKSETHRFTVIWYKVGYYRQNTDKLNTFKLVITDGTDTEVGVGNNVAFYYGDMQWTTGDASGSDSGFYGTPATVGVNNGEGDDACFYYQIGRFGKPGTEYIDATQTSGIDYLDYKCMTFDASSIVEVQADFSWTNLLCAIDFSLEVTNPQNCTVIHRWDFGDGTTSLEDNPLHSYGGSGSYEVNLLVYHFCGNCQSTIDTITKTIVVDPSEDLFKDTTLEISTEVKSGVLSASAATFADTWPLPFEAEALSEKSGYLNGSEGVWRNEGSYVYKTDRSQTEDHQLQSEGTFDLEQFNWDFSDINAIPGWIKANTVTRYSPYSYELENEDVMGVPSAALYDYGGHLPSANGVNMRYKEMAFTGFEYQEGNTSGNWMFGDEALPRYQWFDTEYGYKHIVVVKASLAELESYDVADVFGRNYFWTGFPFFYYRYIRDNEIVCRQEYSLSSEWSVLVLRRPLFNGLWKGHLLVRNELTAQANPDVDSTIAHSGKYSLKITGEESFEQKLLQLDSAGQYLLSAWVSVNELHKTVPVLANDIGITLTLKDNEGQEVATVTFAPEGNIIEGWQLLKGVFTVPVNHPVFDLTFSSGDASEAWFDDLRLQPADGNMRSYVYNLEDYRLQAILDEENYAAFFYYDQEGNLYLTKKETERGIKTINENVSYQTERDE